VSNRPGVRLAIDVGRARVGVARSDPDGLLAIPVETFPRDGAVAEIASLVAEFGVADAIVGLPLSLGGSYTPSTDDAVDFAKDLAGRIPCPVWLVDERLTTVSAASRLQGAGKSAKKAKPIIDQASAVIILQHCLDAISARGVIPGQRIGGDASD
jgi:putative holliday junction resolvase